MQQQQFFNPRMMPMGYQAGYPQGYGMQQQRRGQMQGQQMQQPMVQGHRPMQPGVQYPQAGMAEAQAQPQAQAPAQPAMMAAPTGGVDSQALVGKSKEEQQQMLGNNLYPKIDAMLKEIETSDVPEASAGKITGMLIVQEVEDVIPLTENTTQLRAEVERAHST
eukprot:GABW01000856.1.p1 GENE.GABW01000856.1~~GABW01000856.1.p1  ORF type:complete len:171 (+),score=102.16 GABW01000856.1:24-515(+)